MSGRKLPGRRSLSGKTGMAAGATQYGDAGLAMFLRKSFAASTGLSEQMLERPVVGICCASSAFNSCHRHFPEMLDAISRGATASGALPAPFPTVSLGEPYLSPTSMKFRNLMAMDVEEMIRAQPMDAVVLVGGCDKTLPALLMGSISAGKPAILLPAGPMLTGRHKNERLGACTDCRRYWAMRRAGEVGADELAQISGQLAATSGTCPVMGTASTMAVLAETLGIALPGSATVPAVHADRLRLAEQTGRLAADLAANRRPPPSEFVSAESLENAGRMLQAVAGSTNAVIHLAAIAGRAGLRMPLESINRFANDTPVLVDLKPTGEHYMEDFHHAGGVAAVLETLGDKLHLDTPVIEGGTLQSRLAQTSERWVDRTVVRSAADPVYPRGGLVALFGTLAPQGAVIKRSAMSASLARHTGKAVVFGDPGELADKIDDPNLDVGPDDVLVLKNAGPASESAMPEAGCLPIPAKLAKRGVRDMVRISDARMSGTAYGTVVLHVTPESAKGGPLALVETGDRIRLDVDNRSLDLLVTDAELRKRAGKKRKLRQVARRGYDKLYHENVMPATEGCDFGFLCP